MKIKHRIPLDQLPTTEAVTPEYQAEVDRSMARLSVQVERAEKRLAAAERRRGRIYAQTPHAPNAQHERQVADELVEMRRQELLELHRMLNASPASLEHRGVHNPRPPLPHGVL